MPGDRSSALTRPRLRNSGSVSRWRSLTRERRELPGDRTARTCLFRVKEAPPHLALRTPAMRVPVERETGSRVIGCGHQLLAIEMAILTDRAVTASQARPAGRGGTRRSIAGGSTHLSITSGRHDERSSSAASSATPARSRSAGFGGSERGCARRRPRSSSPARLRSSRTFSRSCSFSSRSRSSSSPHKEETLDSCAPCRPSHRPWSQRWSTG